MFGGEASDKKVKVLSGGERTRLAMVKLLLEPVNFLILDEPTNHLDMRSKDILKDAIREFNGTVIIASHDREFLDGLVTKVYEFGGGRVKEYLGGIYDFLQTKNMESLHELNMSSLSLETKSENKGVNLNSSLQFSSKQTYEIQKENSRRIKKLEKQVSNCEKKIENIEAELKKTEDRMATSAGVSDRELYEQHRLLEEQLSTLVEEWEQLSVELENF
jgi:ATP-binding cassette subfamily F protein 3